MIDRRQFLGGCGLIGAAMCAGVGLPAVLWLLRPAQRGLLPPVTLLPTAVQFPRPPGIITRGAWGALPPAHDAPTEAGFYSLDNVDGWREYDVPLAAAYQTIVIHHSAIYVGDDFATLLEIQRTHREERGWADVGYHYFVGREGLVYEGRDLHVRGTHVARHNTGSLGVCVLGDFTQSEPTAWQIDAVIGLSVWLASRLALTHLAPHSAFNNDTVCPGGSLAPYLPAFAEAAGLALGVEGYIPPPEQSAESRHVCPLCGGFVG